MKPNLMRICVEEMLNSRKDLFVSSALYVIRETQDPYFIPHLLKLMENSDWRVRAMELLYQVSLLNNDFYNALKKEYEATSNKDLELILENIGG